MLHCKSFALCFQNVYKLEYVPISSIIFLLKLQNALGNTVILKKVPKQ